MDINEALERLLKAHERYYTIERENPTQPFAAEADFSMHDERYFLMKSAKISETDMREYVFFAKESILTLERLRELEAKAWETGMKRVEPSSTHKSSDVILYIVASTIEPDAAKEIRKLRRYQSYKFGLQGYSHFKVVAHDLLAEKTYTNRMGDTLKKVIRNITEAGRES